MAFLVKAMEYSQMREHRIGRICTVLLAACMFSVHACDEPKMLNYDALDNDSFETGNSEKIERYHLNVSMISEWAGYILPQEYRFYIFHIKDEKNYYFSTNKIFSLNEAALEQDAFNVLKNPEKIIKIADGIDIKNPFKCDNANAVSVRSNNNANNSDNIIPDDNTIYIDIDDDKTIDKDKTIIDTSMICRYSLGGASAIENTWEFAAAAGKASTKIRIGNGDNFGVSSDVSAVFSDIPVPIMLNSMGIAADVFGNHSFDNQLSYLQNVLPYAKYPYIASNLRNVSVNLPELTAPYVIVNVPAENLDGRVLPIGIVSVLDENINSTVFSGRFGTMGIANYCETIHAMEMAYNKGARAFIIIAHMASLKTYSAFADYVRILSSDTSSENSYACKSMLNIPPNDDELVKKIRKNIYRAIIGVYGDAAANNTIYCGNLTDVGSGSIDENKCKSQSLDNDEKPADTHADIPYLLKHLSLNPMSIDLDALSKDGNDIWVFRIPPQGGYAASLNAEVSVKTDGSVSIEKRKFIVLPTIADNSSQSGTGMEPNSNAGSASADGLLSIEQCQSWMPNACAVYFSDLIQHNDSTGLDAKMKNCMDEINHESFELAAKQDIIRCLYQAKQYEQCNGDGNHLYFGRQILFDFNRPVAGSIVEDSSVMIPYEFDVDESEAKKHSMPHTSLVADAMLRYYNHTAEKTTYDGAILNVGSVKHVDSLQKLTEAKLNDLLPFLNYVVSMETDPCMLAYAIETELSAQRNAGDGADFGGFPTFSGFHVLASLHDTKYTVQQIWKTDENGRLGEIVYLKKADDQVNLTRQDVHNYITKNTLHFLTAHRVNSPESLSIAETWKKCSQNESPGADGYVPWDNKGPKTLKLLLPDYIATGGDGYPFKSALTRMSKTLMMTVREFISPSKGSDADSSGGFPSCSEFTTSNNCYLGAKQEPDSSCSKDYNRFVCQLLVNRLYIVEDPQNNTDGYNDSFFYDSQSETKANTLLKEYCWNLLLNSDQ